MWWVLRGSNSRPTPCKGAALPTELNTRILFPDSRHPSMMNFGNKKTSRTRFFVRDAFNSITLVLAERTGLEPATPGVTGRYSNQLNYRSKTVLLLRLVGVERVELPTYAL